MTLAAFMDAFPVILTATFAATLATTSGCGRIWYDPITSADASIVDGAVDDAGVELHCSTTAPGVVALYPFDPDVDSLDLTDVVGDHAGTIGGGMAEWVSGPAGCGTAIQFPAPVVGHLPDSPSWDLATGSIDLWIRAPSTPDYNDSVLSRDAGGTALPGHFLLDINMAGALSVRMQNEGGDFYYCGETPLSVGRWVHVGMNFGPPEAELWLDGEIAEGCAGGTDRGIDGNDNPWVLGANNANSSEGTSDIITNHLDGVALDHLRISSVRRDFSNP
jgi:hypothetical protein